MSDFHENLTVVELRRLAREKGLRGARVLELTKDQLIYFLDTGAIPSEPERPKQSPTTAGPDPETVARLVEILMRPQAATVSIPNEIADTIADTAAWPLS